MNKKTIALCTGGGDAPGLNAVIRAVTLSALNRGWKVLAIRDGYNGILNPEKYDNDGVFELTSEDVRGITHLGGTIIGTTNRGNPIEYPVPDGKGGYTIQNRCPELVEKIKNLGVDALVAIGGDGSMKIGYELYREGLNVIGIPKTIDNDLERTALTFGFDTAASFATDCIGRLHSTAESHDRIMIVEVMGRYAGWIALYAGIAGTADVILLPEIPYQLEKVLSKIKERNAINRRFSIIVIAEGAKPVDGDTSILGKSVGQAERLGGAAAKLHYDLQEHLDQEVRHVVLGHLQRGGTPTALDRMVSLRFGAAAVRALAEGLEGIMVALNPPNVEYVPLKEVTGRMKLVNLESDVFYTAKELGICFGN